MTNHKRAVSKKFEWFHYDKPLTDKNKKYLSEKFRFSKQDLDSCKQQKTPRPKVKSTKNYSFLVFHIPYRPQNSKKMSVCELNVFVTKTSLVTVESKGDLSALNRFLESTQKSKKMKESRMSNGPGGLLVKLLVAILTEVEEVIDKQGIMIDKLHNEVFGVGVAKRFVERVSLIRYNQVVINNALERQMHLLGQYRGENDPVMAFQKDDDLGWIRVLDLVQSLVYEITSDMRHLEGLMRTFESLVSYRTNDIIKTLTIFSVTLMPLTLITGFFGMNFLSGQGLDQQSLFMVAALMAFVGFWMLFVFKLKKWF